MIFFDKIQMQKIVGFVIAIYKNTPFLRERILIKFRIIFLVGKYWYQLPVCQEKLVVYHEIYLHFYDLPTTAFSGFSLEMESTDGKLLVRILADGHDGID